MLTKKTGPRVVLMQRPAPGGKVRSAHGETEIMSGISTLTALLSIFIASSDLPERLCNDCFSTLLIWSEGEKED